jgi:hypothetical protein
LEHFSPQIAKSKFPKASSTLSPWCLLLLKRQESSLTTPNEESVCQESSRRSNQGRARCVPFNHHSFTDNNTADDEAPKNHTLATGVSQKCWIFHPPKFPCMRISNAVIMLLSLCSIFLHQARHHHQRGDNAAAGSMSSQIRERGNISSTMLSNTKTEKASFIQLALSEPWPCYCV